MLPDALQLRVRKRNSDFQKPWFSKETNLSGEKGTAATQHEFESRGSECFCDWKRPRLRGIISPGSALSRRARFRRQHPGLETTGGLLQMRSQLGAAGGPR